jgi:hypothetical protein
VKAGSNGFHQSKFNAAFILTKGTSCGKVKRNLEVAKIYYQQLKDEAPYLNLPLLLSEIEKAPSM